MLADDTDRVRIVSKDEYENVIGTLVGTISSDEVLEVISISGQARRSGLASLLDVATSLGLKAVLFQMPRTQRDLLKALMFLGFVPAQSQAVPTADAPIQLTYDLSDVAVCA